MIDLNGNLCLSGGAIGADIQWGNAALLAGHGLIHWSFEKHNLKNISHQKNNIVIVSQEELNKSDELLLVANDLIVQRSFPTKSEYVNNLLRRNWLQVRDSQSCYAVSELKDGKVEGGTAWATALFVMKHEFNACPCYVYCQVSESWYEWAGSSWKAIVKPPKPVDIYAGIGSRKLSEAGSSAIVEAYK
jgi:hypothetical protein